MPRTDRMTPPPLIRGAYQIGWGGGCRSEGRRRGPERRVMTVAELWAVQAVSRVELGFRIWEGGGGFITDGGVASTTGGGWVVDRIGGAVDRDEAEDGDRRRKSWGLGRSLKTAVTGLD
jgi:hypothetical protein